MGGCPGGWVPGWVGTQLNSPAMPCPAAPCGAKRSPGTGATTQPCPQNLGAASYWGRLRAPSTAPTAPPAPTTALPLSRSLLKHPGIGGWRRGTRRHSPRGERLNAARRDPWGREGAGDGPAGLPARFHRPRVRKGGSPERHSPAAPLRHPPCPRPHGPGAAPPRPDGSARLGSARHGLAKLGSVGLDPEPHPRAVPGRVWGFPPSPLPAWFTTRAMNNPPLRSP